MSHLVARLAPAADRDDVVQEALARAWANRRLFDPARGTAAAWLLAIAADQAGKARRRSRLHLPFDDDAARAPATADPGSSRRIDVERAVARLSRRQRTAIDCVYFVGLSIAETAAVMRCAEGTVKSTLADARARLRTLLEVAP
jgi:RNA polymerase sigma-70 factor (ECF subfamily)